MFKKILIANRGEIACRVAATAARLAVKTVAVYSDADANAKHVSACDEAVYIGPSAPKESYLRWDKLIEAAIATGAQAIHPGYGFLSENPAFAQACLEAGLVFIGPPAAAMQAMGLKAESKRLMALAGVPLIPGYHGESQDAALLQREADSIGYPVLIKASAGGGGKGMRRVDRSGDFAAALASCQREAQSSFGNDAVLIEKYIERPRHIEIQVFGDNHGNYVHLFERDCSVQRRHQKVLEEAPAPGLTPALREQMGQAALAAARAVNYVGAGTVEFIVEQRGSEMNFFFMEMNTRLQVEHPVTEAITGQDLVEWQLRVAANEELPLRQDQLGINGHAIEARICAENPDHDYLPATGTLQVYQLPAHVEFVPSQQDGSSAGAAQPRFDSGVYEADTISPFYDSMLAKLIVHGETREQALSRLDAALARTHIVGLHTNVQFLRHVAQSRSFVQADLDTALIEREAVNLFQQEKVGLTLALASAIAHTLQVEQQREQQAAHLQGWLDPWQRGDGWRSHGPSTRRFDFQFGSQSHSVQLITLHDGALQLTLGLEPASFSFTTLAHGLDVRIGERREIVNVYRHGALFHIFSAQGASQITALDALAHAGQSADEGGRLTAPMPGKLVSFAVAVGDTVKSGQPLAVMEAMKMEHTIVAPRDGVVAELLYAPGDQVGEGSALLSLNPCL